MRTFKFIFVLNLRKFINQHNLLRLLGDNLVKTLEESLQCAISLVLGANMQFEQELSNTGSIQEALPVLYEGYADVIHELRALGVVLPTKFPKPEDIRTYDVNMLSSLSSWLEDSYVVREGNSYILLSLNEGNPFN